MPETSYFVYLIFKNKFISTLDCNYLPLHFYWTRKCIINCNVKNKVYINRIAGDIFSNHLRVMIYFAPQSYMKQGVIASRGPGNIGIKSLHRNRF